MLGRKEINNWKGPPRRGCDFTREVQKLCRLLLRKSALTRRTFAERKATIIKSPPRDVDYPGPLAPLRNLRIRTAFLSTLAIAIVVAE